MMITEKSQASKSGEEEGELKNLKINKEASKIMKCTIYGRVLIVG